jgi:hypothetical protein
MFNHNLQFGIIVYEPVVVRVTCNVGFLSVVIRHCVADYVFPDASKG